MTVLKEAAAVITGGAKGIGFHTARRLLEAGCRVAIWDITAEGIEGARQALAPIGPQVYGHVCDIADEAQVNAAVAQTERELGEVDILINNAGCVMPGRFCNHPPSVRVRETQVNLIALYYTVYAFLPGMYRRNRGHIVNISSGAGLMGMADLTVYCATKWAVYGFTESLRLEAMQDGKKGVRFSSVHPGLIREGMFAGSRLNMLGEILIPRVKNHDRIARAIVNRALKRNRRVVKYPRSLQLGLLLRALLPDAALNRIMILAGGGRIMQEWKGHSNIITP